MPEHQLPDGPQTLSGLQKIQRVVKPLQFLETYAQHYGDIFTFPMARGEDKNLMVLISNIN